MTTKSSIGKIPIPKKILTLLDDDRIEKGAVKIGMKPSDLFKGVWDRNKKRLSANEIREQAWQKNK